MAAVRVTEADKVYLDELVAAGLAATLAGAVTYVCDLARALRAKENEENGREERGGKREHLHAPVGKLDIIRRKRHGDKNLLRKVASPCPARVLHKA